MEAYNLQTASTYLNNVLLARGLLKGGRPIDFARPSDNNDAMTMARIINLVNELVVQRDVRIRILSNYCYSHTRI